MKIFKINRLKVEGNKKCDYFFETGLNVVQGYHDTGKTNLIEILRFSLGGTGKYIDKSIYDYINIVYCEFTLGTDIYTVKRQKSRFGQKIDLVKQSIDNIDSNTRWEHFNIEDLSNIILNYFQIEGEYFRGRGLKPGIINFTILFNLIYIPQRNWKGIQQSQQTGNPYDRITTFKFSLDIEKEEKQELDLKHKKLQNKREDLGKKREYFVSILKEQSLKESYEIEEEILKSETELNEINKDIEEFKLRQEDQFNRNVKNYRDELNELSKDYEKNLEEYQELDKKISSLQSFKSEIESKFSTLSFDKTAYQKFQAINFSFCPNCRQNIKKNPDPNTCNLCKQKVDLNLSDFELEREQTYLKDTLTEVEYNISLLYADLNEIDEKMQKMILEQKNLRDLIKKNIKVDTIPLIDNLSNLYNSRELIKKKIEQDKANLKFWDYNKSITKEIETVEKEMQILKEKIEKSKKKFTIQKKIVKFTSIYKSLLNEFSDIRTIKSIELSLKENKNIYFPIINEDIYYQETGGAELIIRIVLYYLSLLILFKEGLAKFPPILVIDTPRQQELSNKDYKKLLEILSLHSKDVQIFLCVTEAIPLEIKIQKHLFFKKGTHTID